MDTIIHVGIDDVFDTVAGKPRIEHILVTPGYGKGNVETGAQLSFEDKVRELDAQIAAGEMTQRDWKCRYDYHNLTGEGNRALTVAIGPTSWQEWREDYSRPMDEALKLQELGMARHSDTGFYLSNGLGAAVLTLTRERDVIVGVRKSDSYDGAVHGAAGWMMFDRDVSKINPVQDAYRELGEELAIPQSEVSALHLIGLVAYPKTLEADFVFMAKTDKEREYFTSGAWKSAVDAKEHRDLIVLSNPDQIRQLVGEGKSPASDKKYEVLASTSYGLEALAQHWEQL